MSREMTYTVGDEVRYIRNGRIGTVKEVNENDGLYTIEIDDDEYIVSEDELS